MICHILMIMLILTMKVIPVTAVTNQVSMVLVYSHTPRSIFYQHYIFCESSFEYSFFATYYMLLFACCQSQQYFNHLLYHTFMSREESVLSIYLFKKLPTILLLITQSPISIKEWSHDCLRQVTVVHKSVTLNTWSAVVNT